MKTGCFLAFVLAWIAVVAAEGAGPPRGWSMATAEVRAEFDQATGSLRLECGGREFALAQFMPAGTGECAIERIGGDNPFGPGWMMRIGPGENRVVLRESTPFAFIRRDGRGVDPAAPGRRVEVIRARLDLGRGTAGLKGLGPDGLFDPARQAGQHVVSAIADPAPGSGVVAGLVRVEAVSGVVMSGLEAGRVVLTLRDEYGSAIPPSLAPFGGDWWALGWFEDARDGLEAYAAEFARINGVRVKRLPVGFMTWYSEKHGGALNERAVLELARYLTAQFKDYGYDFLQIDDLWQNGQRRNGPAKDFTRVNPRGPYPGGMKPVAEEIARLGLIPGLWLLPFAIDHQDPALSEQVPLVTRKRDGSPYEVNWSGTALDLTRPEARAYVQGFIKQAVHDWGYRYLKLDGLHIGMATTQTYPRRHYIEEGYGDAVFADKTKSNMQVGRSGLRCIREAAGAETFILGCCTPQNERSLGMTIGLVDAMRVGPDSGVKWQGVVEGVRCAAALYFLNGRVWWNDPDSIYARAAIPLNEVRCLAGWVTLTGMLNNQTDWAPDYPPDRVELLRRTMPSHQLTSVRPADLFENDPARVWVLNYDVTGERHTVIGLFNWGEAEAEIGASAARLGLNERATHAGFEYWSNSSIPPFQGELRQRLPARSAKILAVREMAGRPVLLGTSRHVTQGAVDLLEESWNAASKTFSGAGRVVGGDPYEVRLWTGRGKGEEPAWRAVKIEVSAEDQAAGVRAKLEQEQGLTRARLESPVNRTVFWSVAFDRARDGNDL